MNDRKNKTKNKTHVVNVFIDRSVIQKALLAFIDLNKAKIIEGCFNSLEEKE
ncbi:hypothetical protein L1D22_17950 [Vibrio sp. Isolate34]|uniref:hypothetical protein n=1 Tax=Vibrio sp. Isolate34 TaxID=2908540 RepID=UPI001EFE3932|nr:hypothetical protein [Vibrio sp. Isolate34]MCG9641740.1 hypothetical protein [Vibrio sp. Isolate34]